MRLRGLSVLVLAWCGALACRSPEPPAEGDGRALAKVGQRPITEGEFRRFLANLPDWTASEKRGSALVRDYLQTLVDRLLILQEARSRGLEQAPKVQKHTAQALRQKLIEEIERRQITSRIAVGEAETERAYLDHHWNRQLKIAHILLADRARAEAALTVLRAGRPFAEVAREFSENPRTAPRGGERPYYYTRNNAHPAVRDSLFRLKVGEISGVIPVPKGYEIFKVLDEATLPYDRIKSQVYKELFQTRLNAARQAYVDSLAIQFGLAPNREGLGTLMRVLRAAQQEGAAYLGAAVAGVVLFTHADGQIAIGEAVEQSQFIRQARDVSDSLKVDDYLQRDVVVPCLLLLQAYQSGLDREPEISAWLQRRTEDALVLELRRLEASQKAAVTETEAQQFYQAHPDRYRTSSYVEVIEILVATQAEAEELLAEIRADQYRARPLVALIRAIDKRLENNEGVTDQVQALRSLSADPEVCGWLHRRLDNQQTLAQVIEEISQATSPEDLVEQYIMRQLALSRSLRPGASQVEGSYQLYWYDQGRFGPLVKEAMEADVGALLGPLEHDSFYSIAKVTDRRPAELLSFAEVEKRIKISLQEQREGQLFAQWLEELRQTHKNEVEFFREAIEDLGRQLQRENQGADVSPGPG